MKIHLSLGCPVCNSSNVQSNINFYDEKVEQTECYDEEAIINTRRTIYDCKCNDCNHEYKVDHGYEKHIVFSNPISLNCLGDVKLLALYETESCFENDYKIVLINPSPYDEMANELKCSYLMFIDGEQFPILLSKQTIDEIIKTPEKAKVLVKNSNLSRNR